MYAPQPFSISEVLKEGWRLTKEHLGFLIGYQVILYVLVAIFAASPEGENSVKWLIWHFIGWLGVVLGKMGLYQSALLIIQGIRPHWDQFYRNWALLPSWIVANFLFGLMVFIGFALLIIPGFYILSVFGFFPFLLLNKELGPIDALRQAAELSKGVRWPIFLLFIACLGINLIGLLLAGIGLLITVPITLCTLAIVYKKLLIRSSLG